MTEQRKTIRIRHDGLADEVAIAVRQVAPQRDDLPGLVWLGGFKSDMSGSKASHVAAWAQGNGIGATRFDYSGHGESSGRFEDGTIGRWLAEARAVVAATTTGRHVLIGSSMGGYLALLLAKDCTLPLAGVALIAPAVDMTQLMWARFPAAIKQQIESEGQYLRPSAYGDGPYPITRNLIEEGRTHVFGDRPIGVAAPVRILHGMQDLDVPWQRSQALVAQIVGDDVVLQLIKDGDHRLSRPQDLARLDGALHDLVFGRKQANSID